MSSSLSYYLETLDKNLLPSHSGHWHIMQNNGKEILPWNKKGKINLLWLWIPSETEPKEECVYREFTGGNPRKWKAGPWENAIE